MPDLALFMPGDISSCGNSEHRLSSHTFVNINGFMTPRNEASEASPLGSPHCSYFLSSSAKELSVEGDEGVARAARRDLLQTETWTIGTLAIWN